MSYTTAAGANVEVQQRVSTAKSGVQVSHGGAAAGGERVELLRQLQQQQGQQQQQQWAVQAPEISITDMDTNQVLQQQVSLC